MIVSNSNFLFLVFLLYALLNPALLLAFEAFLAARFLSATPFAFLCALEAFLRFTLLWLHAG